MGYVNHKFLEKLKVTLGMEVLGLPYTTSENLEEYLTGVEDKIREFANYGIEFLRMFLALPTNRPSETPAWKRNRYIVDYVEEADLWVAGYWGTVYWEKIHRRICQACAKYNIVPIWTLTGYSRVEAYFNTEYTDHNNVMFKDRYDKKAQKATRRLTVKLIEETRRWIAGDSFMIEPINEPETDVKINSPRDKDKVCRYHTFVWKIMHSMGLKEDNLQVNITEGINFNTGKQKAARTADRLTGPWSGKRYMDTCKEIKDAKRKKNKVVFTYHEIGEIEVFDNPYWTRLDGGGQIEYAGVSADGYSMKGDGLHGKRLFDFTIDLIKYFGKRLRKRTETGIMFLSHPRGLPGYRSTDPIGGLWNIRKDEKEKYIESTSILQYWNITIKDHLWPMAEAYKKAYGYYPKNYGQYPKAEPPPGPEPTIKAMAKFSIIKIGESSRLAWKSTNADEVSIAVKGIGKVAPNGSMDVSPTETTIYTFVATNKSGIATTEVTIEVIQKPEPKPLTFWQKIWRLLRLLFWK